MQYQKIINLIENKIADAVSKLYTAELRKPEKIHNKIIQKQLQMRMIKKKYLKKDIYLQKKHKKLLTNLKINILI